MKEHNYSMWRGKSRWTAARKAYMDMQNDSTLRKAHGARPSTPTPTGTWSFCSCYRQLRKGSIKKGIRLGQAGIVGKQGHNNWISRGGFAKLLASEHVRPVATGGVWGPDTDDQRGEALDQLQRL
eukprot:5907804-Pyramimonas_sp.AAC.1